MLTGKIDINGEKDCFVNIFNSRRGGVFTVNVSIDGFSKEYAVRNGVDQIDILKDFRESALRAIKDKADIEREFLLKGFAPVINNPEV
jgi:hypothetical protein